VASKTEIDTKVISALRSHPDKWHVLGELVLIFEWKTRNEQQIIRLKIHRSLADMVKLELIEKRELDNYEYKWKVK
jgi:hypothetical protein